MGALIEGAFRIVNAGNRGAGRQFGASARPVPPVSIENRPARRYCRGLTVLRSSMIRGFFRFIGLLLLAAGFIFLIYDGQRSIADQSLRLTRLSEFWNDIHQSSLQALRVSLESHMPWVWTHIVKVVLDQPTFVVLGVIGILLMLVFRPRRRLIGYTRD